MREMKHQGGRVLVEGYRCVDPVQRGEMQQFDGGDVGGPRGLQGITGHLGARKCGYRRGHDGLYVEGAHKIEGV